ncbi:MAG: PilZ domain-containing protein [Proteobacteria bacterium]|uniref:PilZ domain-containing protein n=1 Tax=Aquabacterium sp. TaxID=1872578 RepID=UPI0035C6CB7A|nr:PilZ domain-containing protein [Pseudomonadota bacterium]
MSGLQASWLAQAGGEGDARGSSRVQVSWRARVLLSQATFIECRTLNISDVGVSLLCDRALSSGATLNVALAVPEPRDRSRIRPVTLMARVVFHAAAGDLFKIGMQFVQVDDDTRAFVRQALRAGR